MLLMSTREDELAALRATFFEEAEERISEVESLLLELEQRPDDGELIAPIFRAIHSLKSGGGACELVELANFAHVFENLLDQLRKGKLRALPSTLEVLLVSTDALSALVMQARGFDPPLGEQEIEQVRRRILGELACAGIASLAEPPRIVSAEGLVGMVIWDDEPAAEAAPAEEPAPPHADELPSHDELSFDEPVVEHHEQVEQQVAAQVSAPEQVAEQHPPDEPESDQHGAELSSEQLARLVDLSVELVVASAALSHAVSDPQQLSADRVRGLFTEVQTHANEIESRLTEVRSDESTAISEVVYLCVGEDCYFVPLKAVERYFSPEPGALRKLPVLGELLEWEGRAMPVYRLRRLLGRAGPDTAAVAVILLTLRGRVALLVDEVRTQTRVVVRPLYRGFGEASGLLGAALYAGAVVLVLDPEALARDRTAPPVRDGAHSIQIL
jgi:chemotaxis protein histidine kinase CheA